MYRTLITVSAIVLMTSFGAQAAPITIDSFDTASHNADAPIGPIPSSSEVAGGGILGGYRDIEVDAQTASPSFFETSAEANGGGTLQFENGVGVHGKATFTWDGNDNPLAVDTTGLGGVDLTDGGTNNAFGLDIILIDQPGLEIMFTVWSTSGVSTFTQISGPAGPSTLHFDFSAFTGTADFTDVGAIQLMLTSSQNDGIDAEIDLLEATNTSPVPVPAALPLMAGAIGGLFGLNRLRRRA